MTDLPFSSAAHRNRIPILEALTPLLPVSGCVLEVASGTGQHIVHFAAAHPHLTWQPSDVSEELFAAVQQRCRRSSLTNVMMPVCLDVVWERWPVAQADMVFCANMIHISAWDTACGLIRGAARVLAPGGRLVLYGPFRFGGRFTAPSNEVFDVSLRARNPHWGVRDLDDLDALAAQSNLERTSVIPLPANNHLIVFESVSEGLGHGSLG